MTDKPIRAKSADGIYPRCVFCNGENYMPAVLAYSAGQIPCAAAGGCGKFLPPDYLNGETEMTQYYEPEARALEEAANRSNDHAEQNRLWAQAAAIGTRVEIDQDGDEIWPKP